MEEEKVWDSENCECLECDLVECYNPRHYFDNSKCKCICPEPKAPCTRDQFLDDETCRCKCNKLLDTPRNDLEELCRRKNQRWDDDRCDCVGCDDDEEKKCLDSGYSWDSQTCSCIICNIERCPEPYVINRKSCTCECPDREDYIKKCWEENKIFNETTCDCEKCLPMSCANERQVWDPELCVCTCTHDSPLDVLFKNCGKLGMTWSETQCDCVRCGIDKPWCPLGSSYNWTYCRCENDEVLSDDKSSKADDFNKDDSK